MLPSVFPAFPDRNEFDVYATMNPAKEVGGDFYDFFMVEHTHLAVVMADVSGKVWMMFPMNTGKARISSVEVARFMAAMMVALGHFTFLANEGSSFLHFAYVAVEFFLMLSGFFMMCEVTKKQKDGKAIPSCDALFYALRKVVKIWGIYVVALTFMFVVRVMTSDGMSMQEILGELYHFKWEYLMIHMAGYNPSPAFDVDYLLPPAWYMSAMVIATVPAYFLAAKFQKTYSGLIAPPFPPV